MKQADLFPVRAQLVGHDARQGRTHVLTHFGLGDVHGDGAIGRNLEPYRRREGRRTARIGDFLHRRRAGAARQDHTHAHDEAGAYPCGNKAASRNSLVTKFHAVPSPLPAATLMARWIRGYAMQRQRLPVMVFVICSSLGSGVRRRRLSAVMICPDWQ